MLNSPKVEIRRARVSDIAVIADNMREGDRDEVMASHGLSPQKALQISCAISSSYLRTGTIDDEPACIFGVSCVNVLGGVGAPWLLGTKRLDEVRRPFLIKSRETLLGEMSKGFSLLENYVDERNVQSVRWLKWLGFVIMPPAPFGVAGRPFHRFYKEFSHV